MYVGEDHKTNKYKDTQTLNVVFTGVLQSLQTGDTVSYVGNFDSSCELVAF